MALDADGDTHLRAVCACLLLIAIAIATAVLTATISGLLRRRLGRGLLISTLLRHLVLHALGYLLLVRHGWVALNAAPF
jgi:ABC-type uncharacterized transport system permease subunit